MIKPLLKFARRLLPFAVVGGLVVAVLAFFVADMAWSPRGAPPRPIGPARPADAGPSSYVVSPAWDVHRIDALDQQLVAIRARLDALEAKGLE